MININKNILEELYIKQQYSPSNITQMYGCSMRRIKALLNEYGIKIRGLKEALNTNRHKKVMGKIKAGAKNPMWNGGIMRCLGYVFIYKPKHPRAVNNYVRRSHLIAEKALGRILKIKEMTHHINEIRDDDRPENILVCLRGYHQGLHNKIRYRRKMHEKR